MKRKTKAEMKSLNNLECLPVNPAPPVEVWPCKPKLACNPVCVGTPFKPSNAFDFLNAVMTQKQEETETTMYDERTETQQAKDYLLEAARQTSNRQKCDAEEHFLPSNQLYPKTAKEAREMIAAGKVEISANYQDDFQFVWNNAAQHLQFVDPKIVRDPEGYDEACKQIAIDHGAVKDQIIVFGPEKGLEALNAFKAKTFH